MEERVLLEELCEVRKSVEELRLQYSNIKDMLELLQREMFGMSKYFRNIEADYEWLKDYKENTTMKRLNMILDRFPKTPDYHETGKEYNVYQMQIDALGSELYDLKKTIEQNPS